MSDREIEAEHTDVTARSGPIGIVKDRHLVIGEACARCGHDIVLAPCTASGCDRRVIVCWGCHDVADHYLATRGRCDGCR